MFALSKLNVCSLRRACILLFCIAYLPLSAAPKYYLSICAIFRNEDRFLKEWIEFHRMVGVEHFYLFNHLSEDKYMDVLKPYIDGGIVDLYDWPYEIQSHEHWIQEVQCKAYNKILKEKREESFWIAYIDTDEFIILTKKKNLPKFLKQYEEYGGLVINWQLYGTSNVSKIPEGKTLLETLTKKAPTYCEANKHTKSIVQPLKTEKIEGPHLPIYSPPHKAVNPAKKKGKPHGKIKIDEIRLNHYTTRDEEYFYTHKMAGLIRKFGAKREPDPTLNSVEDPIAKRFVSKLQKRLK